MSNAEKRMFVTGATGLIGTHLVATLVEQGWLVRALTRQSKPKPLLGVSPEMASPLDDPRVELVSGDVTDRDSLEQGMRGCQRVFHLAAHTRNWSPDPEVSHRVNVEGTRHVFDLAEKQGIERIVWTSSLVTLGTSAPGAVHDEESVPHRQFSQTPYSRSKILAEKEALERAQRDGLPVVTVNPTRVFGPGILSEANSVCRVIDRYDRGRMPLSLNLGRNIGNWAFVSDVVEGLLRAMEGGRIGERYILGGNNLSLKQFLRAIDELTGKRHFKIPTLRFAPLVGSYFYLKRAEWFGMYPLITPGWVDMYLSDGVFTSAKAERELGYTITPFPEALRRTWEWIVRVRGENGGRLPEQDSSG